MTLAVSIRDVQGLWQPMVGARPSFSKECIGGAISASIDVEPWGFVPDIEQGCLVRITDPITAECMWDGQVSDPGVVDGDGVRTIEVEGNAARLGERRFYYRPLVTSQGAWKLDSRYGRNKAGSTLDSSLPWSAAVNAVTVKLPGGKIFWGDYVRARFTSFDETDHTVAGFAGTTVSGTPSDSTDWRHRIYLGDPGWGHTPYDKIGAGLPTDKVTMITGGMWPSGQNDLTMELAYNNWAGFTTDQEEKKDGTGKIIQQSTVSADKLWMGLWSVRVYAERKHLNGSNQAIDVGRGLYAFEIVRDLVYRARGVISTGSDTNVSVYSDLVLDSFDKEDLTTTSELLGELCELDPRMWWQLGRTDVATGLAPLNYTYWPSEPRYVLPVGATEYAAAGEDDLCNIVRGIWVDDDGIEHTETVVGSPAKFPDLAGLSSSRESEPIDLSSIKSATNAQAILRRWLEVVATKPRSATATVSVRVLDASRHDVIDPWRIEPGYLAHVPETGDALRVTKVDVAPDGTATLTLGTPRKSAAQLISDMTRKRRRRRNR